MKILLPVLSLLFLTSCAQHAMSKGDHHLHKCTKSCDMHSDKQEVFNKHCAMSLAMGDVHIAGVEDYKIEYKDKVYYFSTEEKMKKFKENMDRNITDARQHWSAALDVR